MIQKGKSTNGEQKKVRNVSNLQRFVHKFEKQFETLTEREVEVLTLIAEGMKNPAIAQTMRISLTTIQTHRDEVQKKLPIDSPADYIKYALAFGLISF